MNRNDLSNPFELPGKWFRAALHAHSCASDGGFLEEDIAARYRKAGFDVLTLTDHERTSDLSGLSRKDFLVINGIELHPLFPGHKCRNHHIVGIGVPHGYPTSRDAQKDVAACMAQIEELGGVAVLAHPPGVNVKPHLYADMPGLAAFELFASHQQSTGGGNREREWAAGLDDGIYLPALAVDDTHEESEIGTAWTMLKMKSLSIKNVLAAIRNGACYASTGPEIEDFRVTADTVEISCSACATITFAGPRGKKATRKAPKTGRGITTHSIAKPDWPFVRAIVTDRAGGKAWTNPASLS